jgi:hypothetical protein
MEPLVWVGVAGVVALVPPVRDRALAVTKATIGVGTGLVAMALRGAVDIATAAVMGEPRSPAGAQETKTPTGSPSPAAQRPARKTASANRRSSSTG